MPVDNHDHMDWTGPRRKYWSLKYLNRCNVVRSNTDTPKTVEECKQTCENEVGCNVILFRNDEKNCRLQKCPMPVKQPTKNPIGPAYDTYYLRRKLFQLDIVSYELLQKSLRNTVN